MEIISQLNNVILSGQPTYRKEEFSREFTGRLFEKDFSWNKAKEFIEQELKNMAIEEKDEKIYQKKIDGLKTNFGDLKKT